MFEMCISLTFFHLFIAWWIQIRSWVWSWKAWWWNWGSVLAVVVCCGLTLYIHTLHCMDVFIKFEMKKNMVFWEEGMRS